MFPLVLANLQFPLVETTGWRFTITKMAPALMVSHSLRVGEEIAIILVFGLSTVAVATRLWVKARLTKTMMVEDYFSFAASLSFLAYIALAVEIGTSGGDAVYKAYVWMLFLTHWHSTTCPVANFAMQHSFPSWNLQSTAPLSFLSRSRSCFSISQSSLLTEAACFTSWFIIYFGQMSSFVQSFHFL